MDNKIRPIGASLDRSPPLATSEKDRGEPHRETLAAAGGPPASGVAGQVAGGGWSAVARDPVAGRTRASSHSRATKMGYCLSFLSTLSNLPQKFMFTLKPVHFISLVVGQHLTRRC